MFLVDLDLVCVGGPGVRLAWCMPFAFLDPGSGGFLQDLSGIAVAAFGPPGPSHPIGSLSGLDGERAPDERASLALFHGPIVDRK